MDIELSKRLMDACYTAKRIRDNLPALPQEVAPSYINILDIISKKEAKGLKVKVSDISDVLGLPRPGVTRTIKEMEMKGYIEKLPSEKDGRIVFITSTVKGKKLSEKFNTQYFSKLTPLLENISEANIQTTIATINEVYKIISENKISLD